MRIKLQTDSVAADTVDEYIILWFGAGAKYLMIQRSIDQEDDPGIYLEFNDQINSSFNQIAECTILEGNISINLKEPMADSVVGFDIKIDNVDSIKSLLIKAFRGQEDKLK